MSHSIPRRAIRPSHRCLRHQHPPIQCLYPTPSLHPPSNPPRRNLSTTRPLPAPGPRMPRTKKQRSTPAMFLRVQDELKKVQSGQTKTTVRDFGMPPGAHFIAPPWKDIYAACRTSPRKWWVVFRAWLTTRMKQAGALITFKRAMGGLLKWKAGQREAPGAARGLFERVNLAFARGDIGGLEDELCDGLRASLEKMIHARPAGMGYRYTLHRWLEEPRLMSFNCVPLSPEVKEGNVTGLIQAVVKLRVVESLQKEKVVQVKTKSGTRPETVLVDAQGKAIEVKKNGELPHNAKTLVHYYVVQKFVYKSQEEHWMAWGETDPTDIDALIGEDTDRRIRKKEAKLGRKNRPSASIS